MSDISIFSQGLPSFLKGVGADELTNNLAGESSGGGMRRLSLKGKEFREMIGGKEYRVSEERSMNVIIVKGSPKIARTYFEGTYVEGETKAPACWSSDSQKPDAGVKHKQSESCLNCPQHIKGSGQGESRACRYSQRLAVVIEGEVEKEEVYQLVLPSTSIFGDEVNGKMPLRAYAELLKVKDLPMAAFVTELRFDSSSAVPKLFFRPIRSVTEEEWEIVQRLKDSKDAQRAIELTVSQADNVSHDEPKPKKALPPPVVIREDDEEEEIKPVKKKPSLVVVEDEEAIEEPKKTTVKKAAAPEQSSLEDLLGEWDDA